MFELIKALVIWVIASGAWAGFVTLVFFLTSPNPTEKTTGESDGC